MSRRQRGYPWPSLAISPYHSSPPAGLQGYILCPHIVAVSSCWSSYFCTSTSRGPQEYIAYELVLASPAVSRKSDLTDKMKRSFFQAAAVSILLYGCTTWTLTKRLERKLDGNYTRMLRAVLNKSWRQHPTRLQLYGHLPPITKTIQVRRTRHTHIYIYIYI